VEETFAYGRDILWTSREGLVSGHVTTGFGLPLDVNFYTFSILILSTFQDTES